MVSGVTRSTGATLEANGLSARDTVLDSQAVLIKAPTPPAMRTRCDGVKRS